MIVNIYVIILYLIRNFFTILKGGGLWANESQIGDICTVSKSHLRFACLVLVDPMVGELNT